MKNSPLLSLLDEFEHTPSSINTFELLGNAPMGETHIAVFFRNVVSSKMCVDVKNPVSPTRLTTLYNIQNARGSNYGILFVVPTANFEIEHPTLLRVATSKPRTTFATYPFTDDKRNLLIMTDTNDNLVSIIGNNVLSQYVVHVET